MNKQTEGENDFPIQALAKAPRATPQSFLRSEVPRGGACNDLAFSSPQQNSKTTVICVWLYTPSLARTFPEVSFPLWEALPVLGEILKVLRMERQRDSVPPGPFLSQVSCDG